MPKPIHAAALALGSILLLLMAIPARAQDAADRALLATFCEAGNIKGNTCKRAKAYPDQDNRACDVKLSAARHSGRFVTGGNPLLVVSYDSGCEPHATNFGGAIVFEQTGGKYNFKTFLPGSQTNDCVVLPRNAQQDILVCITGYMGQGHLETGVAQFVFTRDYSQHIAIAPDFLLTAADSVNAYGANVVTCKDAPPNYFGVSKPAAGPRLDTVTVEVSYADAETIRTACGKGFPKPKETFGTLAKGDAYVPSGYEKKGRVVIDLATHAVTAPE